MNRRKLTIRRKLGKYALRFLAGLTAFILSVLVYLYWPRSLPPKPALFRLIAHQAIHQTYPLDNLNNDTCTATIIYPPTHEFLGNTIPSIRAAFEYGADLVEIDIHPTTDQQLAIFHDWTIDCRTNGKGITHEQSMTALKKLDIGYGYTPDNGKTYPFRGKYVGKMPTFDEIMREFPDKKFLVDQKDTFDKTIKLLASLLKKYPPQQRQNIYLFSSKELHTQLQQEIPEVQKIFPTRKEAKECLPEYLKMLFSGRINEACGKYAIGAPARHLKKFPGWPNLVLNQARKAGLKVYVADVDRKEELEQVKDLPIDGIISNRIEVIGPLLKE